MLEKVQHMATKLVIGFKEFTYEERLKLYRLEECQLQGDLIETVKFFFN